jgi:hypothetical protein
MQLDDIFANARDQDRGAVLDLVDPVEGKPTGLKLWVAGPDSETAHRARLQLADDMADMADASGRVAADKRETARRACLAAHVLRWEVTEEDKPVPFSTANVVRLLKVHWVEQQVDAFAADRRNFVPRV